MAGVAAGLLLLLWLSAPGAESNPSVPEAGTSPADGGGRWLSSPFYLFREAPHHIWLERVCLTLGSAEGDIWGGQLEQPAVRAAIYEILQHDEEDLEDKVRQELRRRLGEEASRRVGLSRCYLLGP